MAKEPFLLGGSRGLRSSERDGEQPGAVVGLTMLEHAEDGVQELAPDRDQGLQFGFALVQQVLIAGADSRRADGDRGAQQRGRAYRGRGASGPALRDRPC